MPALAQAQFDAAIRRQVYLERLKNGEARKVLPFLRDIDKRIRLRLSGEELTLFKRSRLETLLAEVESMIQGTLGRYSSAMQGDLLKLATSEAAFEAKNLTRTVNNPLYEATVPAPAQITAAVMATPLSVRGAAGGLLLPQFFKGYSDSAARRAVGAIRQGVFEGQTNAEIIKAIRGTKAARYTDGLLKNFERQATAVVRTAVQHVSSVAHSQTYRANDDLIVAEHWSSTLDNRTTEICMSLDGQTFKVGEGPHPPAHINCRSKRVPLLDEEFKFLREGATRASTFGPVDANETYFSWMSKQNAAFQDSVIGPTRGKLLRNGGLSAERFRKITVSKNYKPLTLAEMEKLEPLAFKQAGIKLNPETGMPITAKPPTPPKGTPPTAPAGVAPLTSPEPLMIGKGVAVTNEVIEKALREVGTPEAAKVADFVNKFGTSTLVAPRSKLTLSGWDAKANSAGRAKWSEWGSKLKPAPDGSAGLLATDPRAHGIAKGHRGYTSSGRNYIVLVSERGGFKTLAAKRADLKATLSSISTRKDLPRWERSSGRPPNASERPHSFSYEARKMLGLSDDTSAVLTWLHELGHQLDYRSPGKGRIPPDIVKLTQYSGTNDAEWFAEHFVAWVVDRKALKALDPRAVDIIDRAIAEAMRRKELPSHLQQMADNLQKSIF